MWTPAAGHDASDNNELSAERNPREADPGGFSILLYGAFSGPTGSCPTLRLSLKLGELSFLLGDDCTEILEPPFHHRRETKVAEDAFGLP